MLDRYAHKNNNEKEKPSSTLGTKMTGSYKPEHSCWPSFYSCTNLPASQCKPYNMNKGMCISAIPLIMINQEQISTIPEMTKIPKVLNLDKEYLWARHPRVGSASPNAMPLIRATQDKEKNRKIRHAVYLHLSCQQTQMLTNILLGLTRKAYKVVSYSRKNRQEETLK